MKTILVTGGAGYVGGVLVPGLLSRGYRVKVLDLYLYGANVLDAVKDHPRLIQVRGDIRDEALLAREMPGVETVIHLACISNDPSFELDPALGRSINYDAFMPLVRLAKRHGVKRFIFASTSSVYGVKDEPEVSEELSLEPLTDYSLYKARCEEVLAKERAPSFATVTVRPATVCGCSPRMRLDLSVNILTNHAVNKREITVFGGDQKRPNIHIDDMAECYLRLVEAPAKLIAGKVFNAGCENRTMSELALMVKRVVGDESVTIISRPTDDARSYHISSEKIRRELGFVPGRTVEDAVREMTGAHRAGRFPNPLTGSRYYNIRRMRELVMR